MKTILILRHAKSSWKEEGLTDHDRPLNDRGRRDAPMMGRLLARQGIVPDMIYCSTALRARRTAMHVMEGCEFEGSLEIRDELYLAAPDTIVGVLRTVPDVCTSVAVIAHNPGLEELLGGLTGADEHLPTAALAQVQIPIESWTDLRPDTSSTLVEFWKPREVVEV